MTALLLVLSGVLGLVIGSFLNVVIYRVPAGISVAHPASACPNCEHPIRRRDNVPIFSWLALRGRCRDCAAPIAVRYPLVEAGTAVAFVGVGLVFAPAVAASTTVPITVATILALLAFLYLAAASIALAMIDLDTQRLPDVIVLPSYVVGAVLLGVSSILAGNPGQLLLAAIGMAALFFFYLALALGYRGGMGMGDVKLAGVLGMSLGWLGLGNLLVGAFAPFLLGGLFALVLVIARRAGRKSRIPFGPWMLLGAWVGIVAGDAIFKGYLVFVGLS